MIRNAERMYNVVTQIRFSKFFRLQFPHTDLRRAMKDHNIKSPNIPLIVHLVVEKNLSPHKYYDYFFYHIFINVKLSKFGNDLFFVLCVRLHDGITMSCRA